MAEAVERAIRWTWKALLLGWAGLEPMGAAYLHVAEHEEPTDGVSRR